MKYRQRQRGNGQYAGVCDGNIWKSFHSDTGEKVFGQRHDFGVMLHVDWFQPYKRRKDKSVGAIYLVFVNLPREMRFQRENVILVGLILPFVKEPSSLNSFLKPLVSELQSLWEGVMRQTYESDTLVLCRIALICAAANIPAARKLCGFLGHSARQGCSFCKVSFQFKGKILHNRFDVNHLEPRSR